MDELTDKIKARIAELEAQLPKIVEEANRQIAAHQAAIGELKHLLEPTKAVEEEKNEDDMNYHK